MSTATRDFLSVADDKSELKNELLNWNCNVPIPTVSFQNFQDDKNEILCNSDGVLFSENITNEDEIWLLQSPADISVDSFANVILDFQADISKIKIRTSSKKKNYFVYGMKNDEQVNCILPNKSSDSLEMRILPLTGRLVLQQDIKMKSKIKSENS